MTPEERKLIKVILRRLTVLVGSEDFPMVLLPPHILHPSDEVQKFTDFDEVFEKVRDRSRWSLFIWDVRRNRRHAQGSPYIRIDLRFGRKNGRGLCDPIVDVRADRETSYTLLKDWDLMVEIVAAIIKDERGVNF
jgi:hypothetical protein